MGGSRAGAPEEATNSTQQTVHTKEARNLPPLLDIVQGDTWVTKLGLGWERGGSSSSQWFPGTKAGDVLVGMYLLLWLDFRRLDLAPTLGDSYGWVRMVMVSLNVKGLNNPTKWRAILSYLAQLEVNICLLQETHLLPKDTHRMRSKDFPLQYFSSVGEKKAGVAILIARRCKGEVKEKAAEIKGRLLAYNVTFGPTSILIGSIYTPNSGQERFIKSALSDVLSTQKRLLLVGGDLNVVMDASCDRSHTAYTHKGELSLEGRRWLDKMGLVDIWRTLHPTSTQYTFFSHAHRSYARLDHYLGS